MTRPATLADLARSCGDSLPLPPGNTDGPVFAQPWQAHAFALTLQLHERGVFTWPQWAAALSGEITAAQAAGDTDNGQTYYHHWLNALEKMVLAHGLGTDAEIHRLEHAWQAAAARTPHGQPIELQDSDEAPA